MTIKIQKCLLTVLSSAALFLAAQPVLAQCTRSCGRPSLTVNPTSLAFLSQVIGTTSLAQTITIRSLTPGVVISGIESSGTPFFQTNDCPKSMGTNRVCHIDVTFAPTKVRVFHGYIKVNDNVGTGAQKVTVSGMGLAADSFVNQPDSLVNPGNSEQQAATAATPGNARRYKLIDLGTLGGAQSYVNIPDTSYARVLNSSGEVAGWADTQAPDPFPDFCFDEDCAVAEAFRWEAGRKKKLGPLPGGASSSANWISENGLIAGISENGDLDPLVPGFPELRAVMWKGRHIVDLGTLEGGYESIATAVNDQGQVVGFATNTVADPDSMVGLGYQTRAFLWQNGVMRDLGTLGTGTDSMALLINQSGQVAGNSYTNTLASSICADAEVGSNTTGAFLWEKGVMKDIGNFGGSCTFASDLNNHGQITGGSHLAGDQVQHPFLWNGSELVDLGTFGGNLGNGIALNDSAVVVGWATYPGDQVFHAAVWKHGKIKDLGALSGDTASFAFAVNSVGQVIGISVPPSGDFGNARAFLWEKGKSMVSLESLVTGGSPLRLTAPETINNRGEIAGTGFDSNGDQRTFLLIPCDRLRLGTCEGDVETRPRAGRIHLYGALPHQPGYRGNLKFRHTQP